MENYYDILGVSKTATADEIKKAYRKKSLKYHPDNQESGCESEFKKVNEAYQVLSNESSRNKYDNPASFSGFNDIFSNFAAGFRRAQRPIEHVRVDLDIDLEDSFFGRKKKVTYNRKILCDKCSGLGTTKNENDIRCKQCSGSGRVTSQVSTMGFNFSTQVRCPKCNGTGKFIEEPDKCQACSGRGYRMEKKDVEISVPRSIDSGDYIALEKMGHQNGYSSDLIIVFFIRPHSKFERHKENLFFNYSIDEVDAILGKSFDMEMIDGSIKTINIHGGIQHGENLVVEHEGLFFRERSRRGNLIIKININISKNITKKEKELFREIYRLRHQKEDD